MTILEQEEATLDKKRAVKEDELSFSATLQKAIDLSSSSSKTVDDTQNDKRFYYSMGANNFLIEQDLKAETLNEMPVNQIPFSPDWYMGLVSIRGVIMPVIDMNDFVNSQTMTKANKKVSDTHNDSYFLKLEHNDHSPIVIKIDGLPKQISISTMKKRKAAKTKPAWMIHTMKHETSSITEVDHQELLNKIKELS